MEQFTSKRTAGIWFAKLGVGAERRKIPVSMDDSMWSIKLMLQAYNTKNILGVVGASNLIYNARSFGNVEEDAFKLFTLVKYGFWTKPRLNFMNITTFKTNYWSVYIIFFLYFPKLQLLFRKIKKLYSWNWTRFN